MRPKLLLAAQPPRTLYAVCVGVSFARGNSAVCEMMGHQRCGGAVLRPPVKATSVTAARRKSKPRRMPNSSHPQASASGRKSGVTCRGVALLHVRVAWAKLSLHVGGPPIR